MLISEQALYLGRIVTGSLLASAAVWVAFGPELLRALSRRGLRLRASSGSEGASASPKSPPS